MPNLKQIVQHRSKLRTTVPETASGRLYKMAPIPGAYAIAVQYRFKTLTDDTMKFYSPSFLFHDINFSAKKDASHQLRIEVIKGKFLYANKPSFSSSKVQIVCTCRDFFYTWWYYNKNEHGVHLGPDLPSYTRKTDTYPARNPNMTLGCCKHIIRAIQDMSSEGFLQK